MVVLAMLTTGFSGVGSVSAVAQEEPPGNLQRLFPDLQTWKAARARPAEMKRSGPGAAAPAARPVTPLKHPAAATAAVAADPGKGWRSASGTPVSVATASSATVSVVSEERAAAAGVAGVVFTVTTPEPVTDGVPVRFDAAWTGSTDLGRRLHLVSLPACALTTPDAPECRTQTPLADAQSDQSTQVMSATAPSSAAAPSKADAGGAAGSMMVLAAVAGSAGSSGTYAASSLAPSGSWSVAGSSGAFTWSYPVSIPAPAAGPTPQVALSYDSSSIDGRIASTNNQSSWVGQGWDYSPGFIERSYVTCAKDPAGTAPKVGDLCWAGQVVTLSRDGHSVALVRDDATGVWHLAADDGTRVERLTGASNGALDGEHWKVTAPDGTAYVYGLTYGPGRTNQPGTGSTWTVPVYGAHPGDPCYNSSGFAASVCTQAWRWNLDYVQDVHGNAALFSYTPETNGYGQNGSSTAAAYTRGGYLSRIDYGLRLVNGSVYTSPAPDQVVFGVTERCTPSASFTCDPALFTAANAANWPDTPQDQSCPVGGSCSNHVPTFWSTKRLTLITTQVSTASGYAKVDDYALTQSFPNQGDASMWLASVTHTGYDPTGAALATPPVSFSGQLLDNRVAGYNTQPPMLHWRLGQITTETGAITAITYSPTECTNTAVPTPDSNTVRCFPVYWTLPYQSSPTLDFFHKYVVTQVMVQEPHALSPTQLTTYTYLGAPAWHFDDNELVLPANRTWGQFRGYGTVEVRAGNPASNSNGIPDAWTLTRTTYLRGMDGDKTSTGTRSVSVTNSLGETIPDSDRYSSTAWETLTFDGDGGGQVTSGITDPGTYATTASRARSGLSPLLATVLGISRTRSRTALAAGGAVETSTRYTRDGIGRVTQATEAGTGVPDRCTTTRYADNATLGIRDRVAEVIVSAQVCPDPAVAPTPVLADTRTLYDGSTTLGTLPGPGDPTTTLTATSASGGVLAFAKTSRGFDASGRATTSTSYTGATDTVGRTTTIAFTPALGGVPTHVATTNPAGQTATVSVNLRGQPTRSVDIANHTTDATYDALGRLTGVWAPGQTLGSTAATVAYSYLLQTTGPQVVTATTLTDTGTASGSTTTTSIYDALGQLRQVQTNAAGGGRIVEDTVYDSHGWAVRGNHHWFTAGDPDTTLITTTDDQIDSYTTTSHDGTGRPLVATAYSRTVATWSSRTVYGGDRTTLVPPAGGTTTTTVFDARGHTTALWSYTSAPAITGSQVTGGTHLDTGYRYNTADQLDRITDPSGRPYTYTYDLAGRVTQQTDPDTGTTTRTYNDTGDLLTVTGARGTTLTYSYDSLARPTTLTSGPGTTALAAWTYDTLQPGKPTSSTTYSHGDTANPYTIAATGYDSAGNPTGTAVTLPASEGPTLGGKTYTTSQTWTSTHLPRTTTPAVAGGLPAETLTHTYTTLGDPLALTSALGQYVYTTLYTPSRMPQAISARNGYVGTSYTYDAQTLRRQGATFTNSKLPSSQLEKHTYTYDPAGNITRIADVQGGAGTTPRTSCYAYDPLRQLTGAWTATDNCAAAPTAGANSQVGGPSPMWLTWTYTANTRTSQTSHQIPGTATGDTTTGYTYADSNHPNAITTAATSGATTATNTYTYDPAGNTVTRALPSGSQALTWTPDNHLDALTGPAGTTSYVYAADGSQLIRHDPTATTVYLPGEELTLTTSTNTLSGTRYYAHAGQAVALRTGSTTKLLYADHTGTITTTTDWTTNATTRRTLDPYGNPIATSPTWPDSHGYLNQPTNSATGLTDTGHRKYDPTLGAFISTDPLLDPTKPSTSYAYANNNPIGSTDPSGLRPVDPQGNELTDTNLHITAISGSLETSRTSQIEKRRAAERVPARVANHHSAFRDLQSQRILPIAQSPPAEELVILYAFDGGCSFGTDAYSQEVARAANDAAFRMLIPVDEFQGCREGTSLDCGMLLASVIPYGKVGSLAKVGKFAKFADEAAKSVDEVATVVPKAVHGNSASSTATNYLYRLYDSESGAYLKTGITKNPGSRYTKTFMQDREMEILQTGTRREMLNLERFIVERDPGPLNREPWAGSMSGDVP
ncbi:MAG: RHS repeat-associated core domain-containing protein [Dermatophilaceae bacterium]